MKLSLLSLISAFFAWCVIDTSLHEGHLRNSDGEITFRSTLVTVLVQIGLWCGVLFAVFPILRHLPAVLITGWRLGLSTFIASTVRWFALLMVIQYIWLIGRATLATFIVHSRASAGSESARNLLDNAPRKIGERNIERGGGRASS